MHEEMDYSDGRGNYNPNEELGIGISPRHDNVKLISCKKVYKVKSKPNRSVERFKSKLVAHNFSQQYKLDYEGTFRPVAELSTI
uniref:Reverse transcriptase Ty1/copia-type domain-containing protein n=1 Tax=Lactuca sativa TaxID=4236 RepID=A0A9R1UE79_LACSA|nr:hypothetical protein LSAT_V11C900468900 [Lactuca sativa]